MTRARARLTKPTAGAFGYLRRYRPPLASSQSPNTKIVQDYKVGWSGMRGGMEMGKLMKELGLDIYKYITK